MPDTTFIYNSTSNTVDVADEHFGLNLLFTQDKLGGVATTDYETVAANVENKVIRYAGGTMSEAWFDPANPNATSGTSFFDGEPKNGLTPLDKTMQYAADSNSELLIVIPTGRYFNSNLQSSGYISGADKEAIRDFVEAVIADTLVTSGQVQIAGFEIGNEWYQDNFNWTVEQFGELSSQIAKVIQQRIDSVNNGQDPMIFVQSGRTLAETEAIRDQFGRVEYDAVDGDTTHFYTTNSNGNPMGAGGGVQGRLNDIYNTWNDPNGTGDIPVLVSEWNVGGNGPTNTSLSGLMRNAPLMRTFAEMIENGVDIATFWTAIAAGDGAESLSLQDNGSHLTPTGYLYRMLSENVVGTELQTQNSEFRLPGDQGYAMVFEGSDQAVIYLTSGTAQQLNITANLTGLINSNSHI
ncbi:hypothetical protein K3727_10490 [Rhodobacteraceae bacterium M382]|nr:hypothetical protein K3727_10490 [Rhodobacteraceae bacterium M382]